MPPPKSSTKSGTDGVTLDVVDGAPPTENSIGAVTPGVSTMSRKAKQWRSMDATKQIVMLSCCILLCLGISVTPGAVLVGIYWQKNGDTALCENQLPYYVLYYGWWIIGVGLLTITMCVVTAACVALSKGEGGGAAAACSCLMSCGLLGVSVYVFYLFIKFNIETWGTGPTTEAELEARRARGEHLQGCDDGIWYLAKHFLIAMYVLLGLNCCLSCCLQCCAKPKD